MTEVDKGLTYDDGYKKGYERGFNERFVLSGKSPCLKDLLSINKDFISELEGEYKRGEISKKLYKLKRENLLTIKKMIQDGISMWKKEKGR